MMLFGGLAEQVSRWERTLSREEAQAKVKEYFLALDDEGFEMLNDLLDMMGTEPGRRLTGDINLQPFHQILLELKVIRMRKAGRQGSLYRVFVEDVGVGLFSAFSDHDVLATSPLEAIFQVTEVLPDSKVGKAWIAKTLPPTWNFRRLIALPLERTDLWPDGKTGKVPKEALEYR